MGVKYTVEFTRKAEEQLEKHKKAGNFSLLDKIYCFYNEIEVNPRKGNGRPKKLQHYNLPQEYRLKNDQQEIWSRRIDRKHRMIYTIEDKTVLVVIISVYGHYWDK